MAANESLGKWKRLFHAFGVFTLVVGAMAQTACGSYWSKFNFRVIPNGVAPAGTRIIVADSVQVEDRINSEELREAGELRRIRALPLPKRGDKAGYKAWSEARDKLVNFQVRAAFLADFQARATVDVPLAAQGKVVRWSECSCTLSPASSYFLVKVRVQLPTERRVVEGWVCSDAIELLHILFL